MQTPNETGKRGEPGVAIDDSFELIDAGPAPIEHIMRLSRAAAASSGLAAERVRSKESAKTPLNPLRAGAAAARKMKAAARAGTVDAGAAAKIPARGTTRNSNRTRNKAKSKAQPRAKKRASGRSPNRVKR